MPIAFLIVWFSFFWTQEYNKLYSDVLKLHMKFLGLFFLLKGQGKRWMVIFLKKKVTEGMKSGGKETKSTELWTVREKERALCISLLGEERMGLEDMR